MEDGAFAWLIVNSKTTSDSTRRHIELALCHLAQNGTPTIQFSELRKISLLSLWLIFSATALLSENFVLHPMLSVDPRVTPASTTMSR